MLHRGRRLAGWLLLLSLMGFTLALAWGGDPPALASLPGVQPLTWDLIAELRLPRALSAWAVGGLLALAGLLMQILLRNPLGDPYLFGVSGGATLAVLVATLAGLPATGITGSAWLGALASLLALVLLSRVPGRPWSPNRMLLTGVVLAFGWSALVSLVLTLAPAARLPGMLFWLLGDLSDADMPALPLVLLALGSLVAWSLARPLDLLQQGEDQAAVLGVAVEPLRRSLFFLGALLTAAAVSTGGSIGFVGLVVPHLTRRIAGASHRWLVPNSVLLGGGLLLLADTLAKILIAPRQLPVGILTALLGVPWFLWLLTRKTP